MGRSNQASFANVSDEFKDYWKATNRKVHGGSHSKGKRKTERPFDSRKPIHLIFRSSRAKGSLSLWRHKTVVLSTLNKYARLCGIKFYEYSNNGNHIHILLKASDKKLFGRFLKTTTGLIARVVLGAKKGDSKGKFWDELAFTRIGDWGRAYDNLKWYVIRNIMEAAGVIPYKKRKYEIRPQPT